MQVHGHSRPMAVMPTLRNGRSMFYVWEEGNSLFPFSQHFLLNINCMKKLFLLYAFCFWTLSINAQVSGFGIFSTNLPYLPYDISKQEVLDSTKLVIWYSSTFPDDDVKNGSVIAEDKMELQIGTSIQKFFSKNLNYLDRMRTYNEKPPVPIKQNYTPYEIYTKLAENEYSVVTRQPFSMTADNKVFVYKEKIPAVKWEITGRIDFILGYKCTEATTNLYGRIWNVWFAPEIPISTGPWKLRGLPGVILKAEDADSIFSFCAVEISQNTVPIVRPLWHYQELSKKAWKKYEQGIHVQPYVYCSEGGKVKIFNVFTREDMGSEWAIPYIPLELEE